MDRERLHTIAGLRAAGKSVRQIARATGTAKSVVHRAVNGDVAGQIINELRPQIAARLSQKMLDMVDDPSFAPKYTELGILYGIAMDKHLKAEALEKPAQDNRTLVIVIPGLDPPVSRDDLPTIEGRHTTTTLNAPLDPDILPPSD